MKELVKLVNPYNEQDQMIEQEAEVYSLVSEQMMVARDGYQIIRRTFVRERDQKVFEARFYSGDNVPREHHNLILLEKNMNPKPKDETDQPIGLDLLRLAFKEGVMSEFHLIRGFLFLNGYKIVKDGREENGQSDQSNDTN